MSSTEVDIVYKASLEAIIFGTIWTVLGWLGSEKARKACMRSKMIFMTLYVIVRVSLTNFERSMGNAFMSSIFYALPFTELLMF